MKVITVTGTPGTGKTTFAKDFAKKKKYAYLDGKDFITQSKKGYDQKRSCVIIDEKKFIKSILSRIDAETNKGTVGVVVDSHLSHLLPKKRVTLCVVTKTRLKTLALRLKKRGYSKTKIRENLDAEIFDVCFTEAKEQGHKIKIISS